MRKLAIDVVLLPEKKISEFVIELNRVLVKGGNREIVLGANEGLAHISLCMGALAEGDLEGAKNVLYKVAQNRGVGKLRLKGVDVRVNSAGNKVSSLEVEGGERLQRVHEQVVEDFDSLLEDRVERDMLADEWVSEKTLEWIRNYRYKASFDNFWPHITVGVGQLDEDIEFPVEFKAECLAICQLGNHCTCKKIVGWESIC